jgi:hypothetical protein
MRGRRTQWSDTHKDSHHLALAVIRRGLFVSRIRSSVGSRRRIPILRLAPIVRPFVGRRRLESRIELWFPLRTVAGTAVFIAYRGDRSALVLYPRVTGRVCHHSERNHYCKKPRSQHHGEVPMTDLIHDNPARTSMSGSRGDGRAPITTPCPSCMGYKPPPTQNRMPTISNSRKRSKLPAGLG